MSLKIKKRRNVNEKYNYIEANLLMIEENIEKLNLLEKEKDKKIFSLKRKIQEKQDKKNKFIAKTFKTIDDINELKIVCNNLGELDILESVERTLKTLKDDLRKSAIDPIKNVDEIISKIDNEEDIRATIKTTTKSKSNNVKLNKNKIKKIVAIGSATIIFISGFIILYNKNQYKKDGENIAIDLNIKEPEKDIDTTNELQDNENENTKENLNNYEIKKVFSEGLAAVKQSGKWGYINEKDELVIDIKYENAKDFSEELAVVKRDGEWGYIDKKGTEIIKPEYEDAKAFSEGLAPIKKNGKWGYIDKKGTEIIKPQYDNAEKFSNGIANVRLNNTEIKIKPNGDKAEN